MADLAKGRHVSDTTSDVNETHILLQEILVQLRIMNLHFAEWDSTRISEKDLFEDQEQ